MIKTAKKIFGSIILQAIALASPAAIFADPSPAPGDSISEIVPGDMVSGNTVVEIVAAAIKFILIVAFVLAFVFLIIGGIRWIIAGGDEKGVAAARGMITGALIGLVIVLASFALIKLIEAFFGVTILGEGSTIGIPIVGQP